MKKEIKKEIKKERFYFISFVITSLILFVFILSLIPIDKMQVFLIGILSAIILAFIIGLPIFFYMMWQNQKDYIKELKLLNEVNNDTTK